MQLLIIENNEELRTDIIRRIEEASRSTGLRGISIEAVEMKKLGASTPDLIILGGFAKDTILEIHSRLNSIFPNTPIILLLNSGDYLEDAVELYKRTMIRVVAQGDLPQISQIILNLSRPNDYSTEFKGKARIISLVNFKGGVGTTTTAASLAAFYEQHGISCLLIDLNYANRDLSIFNKYSIEGQSALALALKSPYPEMKELRPCIEKFRQSQISSSSIIGAPESFLDSFQLFSNRLPINEINPGWLESTISKLAEDFEALILDLGNHWGVSTLASLALSTHIGLITEENEWSIKRTFSMLNILSNESEDPGEFDFRKWQIIINGARSPNSASDLVTKYNNETQLIKNSIALSLPWSKKCADWFICNKTAYELAEPAYKDAIELLARGIRPF